ncbi:hypothetical protein [Moorella sulfitireducens (nom. illeg.)]|uniref:hypothetical protein n=1 Tax=Neomoorella sulfitireducens TaxID=2972948 RepID=UPI0021ACDB6C|nr:hypothetical protein [Moorella sulfitireducens]
MQEIQNCEVNKVLYKDPPKLATRLHPTREDPITIALDGLAGEQAHDDGATVSPPLPETGAVPGILATGRPYGSNDIANPGAPEGSNPDSATAAEPSRQHSPPQSQPLTLAAHSQALFREAILNGSVNQVLAELRVWIEKIRAFLMYADTGIETAGNIVNIAKGTLEKELGLAPAAGTAGTISMQLPASSLELVWNLIRTPEFQQFTGRMLAQVLKIGLNPPPQGESSG